MVGNGAARKAVDRHGFMKSLAFRKHEPDIRAGNPPAKYVRILPFIKGDRIIEIGSAEGVLALLLARMGKLVVAVEKSEERHKLAQSLYAEWEARENGFSAPTFVNGDIADNLWALGDRDTLLCVRSIYYLGNRLDAVFSEVAKAGIRNIVLCGNKNRAQRWRAGTPDEPLGDFNRYAAREGMTELLRRHGYQIAAEATEGDEIVVGQLG